jgi:ATPase subunit of ABC transporter with duplicated ATPase domains
MKTTFRVIGVTAVLALVACSRNEQPKKAESQSNQEAELRTALAEAVKSAESWKSKAESLEPVVQEWKRRAESAEEMLRKSQESAVSQSQPTKPVRNEDRPVGERVIRVWDMVAKMRRDVRIQDFEWTMHLDGTVLHSGTSKTNKSQIVEVKDQVAEAWVIEFVTGRKAEIPR